MGQRHPIHQPETEPGIASAEDGQVLLDGPDGVAIAMTPECALGTAHSLLGAAREAMGQRDAEAHPS